MKFIKAEDYWLNRDLITTFTVSTDCAGYSFVKVYVGGDSKIGFILKRFKPIPGTDYDARAEAQAWLDEFVAKLNEEK